jgi:uncharacterized membrane protein YGL010W
MLARIMGTRTSEQWVAEYADGHTHPVNQACHAIGIPMIAASVPLFVVALFSGGFWRVPVALFTVGWGFQFLGHAFEGKPPEFIKDPRFLFVGLRWWIAKRLGRV